MHLAVPSLILIGAVITDLRTKKVFNWFVVVSFFLALANSTYFFGATEGLKLGLLGAGMGLVMTLPLFMARVLGGGDVKLIIALGAATSYSTIMNVVFGSFVWAALIGVIYATLNGTVKILALNTLAVLKGQKPEPVQLHHLPFSVALFFAWISHLVVIKAGGHWW